MLKKNGKQPPPAGRRAGGEGKIALVHDHLAQDGGAERVLWLLAEMYPQAPIYTLLYKQEYLDYYIPHRQVRASFIQSLPGGVSKYQWYMPFMPTAIESYDLQTYDLVISSASSFAKGVITPPEAIHICYCHTPTRYLWHYANQYIAELRMPEWLKKIVGFYVTKIRQWDKVAAERVDYFIANSATTQKRISKYYGRGSVVIHPPVDTHKFFVSRPPGNYFLAGARFIPHKRLDIAVQAFNKLGIPLKVFGDGPDLKRIKKMAGGNIEFLGRVSESAKARLMSECQAFIHPQEEDFGITAIEVQASGRPVIAYNKGGARETIIHGQTGILFNEQTWEDLADTVLRFLYKNEFDFSPEFIKQHAEQFNAENFKMKMRDYINTVCHSRE
ncbi:glycosyltransferase family 4 protein [Candidatus Falkowbacteria bacterium CG10_big_fil_rev_8_21_14_0_10_43_10]|uniref:Glycosyltransferase family 4 protein n=1 Tax=Candidatus Falkowbacteria bacterium CG10_big_fil_rev_8_21_14_0_10_43_10 TaxID=1974567 RepID=A0A2H0V2I1_9BACT|nr:MAG: glycosyltransferase family 4 protein [Candidatus Falkowbacteria bacterium CG10_big_fil_rev_8_21_14_0_10_43_10]